MNILKEPEKPIQAFVLASKIRIDEVISISDIEIEIAKIKDVSRKESKILVWLYDDYEYDRHYARAELQIWRKETDTEFQIRLAEYNLEREKYDLWYESNKEDIEIELTERKKAKIVLSEIEEKIELLKKDHRSLTGHMYNSSIRKRILDNIQAGKE